MLEGPDERDVADEILRQLGDPPTVVHLDGPLGVAAAILRRAKLYVGSDSGLAHLAAAVGTPPVTIFAAADPDRVCPFGYRHLVVRSLAEKSPGFLYPWEATRPRIRPGRPDTSVKSPWRWFWPGSSWRLTLTHQPMRSPHPARRR